MRYLHLPGDADEPRLAALVADRVVELADVAPNIRSLDDLVRAGPGAWARLRVAAHDRLDDSSPGLPAGPLPPPLTRPSKIVAMGAPRLGGLADEPTMFAKFPSSLVGSGMPISWPPDLTQHVDGQANLAVVVGRRLRRASPEECLDGVFGYSVANDLTARDLVRANGQWTRGKNLDGFCPVGPLVVTAEDCPDPQSLRLSTYVNSALVHEINTREMSLSVGELLSVASGSLTLHAGDVVLAGGLDVEVLRGAPAFLSPGDEITVTAEGIGDLTNPVLPFL